MTLQIGLNLKANGMCSVAWREILKEGPSHNFHTFYKSIFFGKTNLKLIEKQESLKGGPGACSLGKFLKIYMLQWLF